MLINLHRKLRKHDTNTKHWYQQDQSASGHTSAETTEVSRSFAPTDEIR